MLKWWKVLMDSRAGRLCTRIVQRYFEHDVGRQSAALAYYMLFTLFPLLIFLSSLLGLLNLNISGIMKSLQPLFPSQVLEIVETYLTYVSQTSSTAMLWFGLVFSVYFPMRAADCLMQAVRRAYRLGKPKNQFVYMLKVLLYTIMLLMTVALTLVLMTVGGRALTFLGRYFVLPHGFIRLWNGLRFVLLGVVVFSAVGILYAMAQETRRPSRGIVPGVLLALAMWMLISAVYAFYVENFGNYSVIYGTLGAVIVLLIWLNLTSAVLIMGAEINGALLDMDNRMVSSA